jgi:L-aspartate oxidase
MADRLVEIPCEGRGLVPFHPKRVPHLFTDVLVLGGGIAGIRACGWQWTHHCEPWWLRKTFCSSRTAFMHRVALRVCWIHWMISPVTRRTQFLQAKGSVTAASWTSCGGEAPQRIQELVGFGAEFDRVGENLALTLEGGHSHARVAHALGDATGQEVMRAMTRLVQSQQHIDFWEKTFILDLLTEGGTCRGALVWNANHGRTFVWAKQTILCTGGAGRCIAKPRTRRSPQPMDTRRP